MSVRPRLACPFAQIVYQLLVVEKLVSVRDMAARMQLSYAALHSRLYGRTRFTPGEARQLIGLIGDARLAGFFLDGSSFVLAHRALTSAGSSAELRHAVANAIQQAVDVVRIATAILEKTTTVNHHDQAAILTEVGEAETALAGLRIALERGHAR